MMRYRFCRDMIADCYCEMEHDSDGDYLRYDDAADLLRRAHNALLNGKVIEKNLPLINEIGAAIRSPQVDIREEGPDWHRYNVYYVRHEVHTHD